MSNYDLIIVGGGMVGLAFAAKLKGSDLKIAIVDSKPVQMEFMSGDYDLRVSAITRASENLLKEVNAWHFIEKNSKSPYKKMFVWDGESTSGEIEFSASSIGQDNLGHIIENRTLRRALYQSINNEKNIELIFEDSCKKVSYSKDFAELRLESGKTLSASLLIAADGALSWLRNNSSIETNQSDYGHKAIVATIKTEVDHKETAFQRFDQKGPLAFLPFKESHFCSIVWSQENYYADQLCALGEPEFIERLEQAFEFKLGKLELSSERLSFPLIERTVDSNIHHRLALIGDAAHTIHPLAGQGVNLGFSDAQILAETVLSAHKKSKDIGLQVSLRPYQRQRASDTLLMQQSMRLFKNLFSSTSPIIEFARASGMSALNKQELIKNSLMKKALGI